MIIYSACVIICTTNVELIIVDICNIINYMHYFSKGHVGGKDGQASQNNQGDTRRNNSPKTGLFK